MNKCTPILLQQVSAGFFLALFLFVHVVKISHHHNLSPCEAKGLSKGGKTAASADCAICTYQVIKDSHHFNGFPLSLKAEEQAVKYLLLDQPFITSVGSISCGRGPPSCS